MNTRLVNMLDFSKLFLRYFIIIFLVFLFECIYSEITLNSIHNLLENILFSIVLICPLYFINNNLNKYYFIISFLFFSLLTYLESVYYYLFNRSFNSSAIFIALESNNEEAKEFINFYVDAPIIFFTIVILIAGTVSLLRIDKVNVIFTFSRVNKLKILGLFIGIFTFLKLSTLIVFNLPYLLVKSSIEYYEDFKKFDNYKNNKVGDFVNVSRASKESEKEVYVVIIGESVSRSHMGIYNYSRATTPLLKEIENELLVYENVISPHTYTIASLSKSLTLGNFENPERKYKGSIIQLLNQAKFKTYWISNQKPVGVFDSQVTKIGLGAYKSFFLNIKHPDTNTNFDEVLVNQLDEVFLEEGNKKVIFLHMIGAHMDYKKRYPENFNYFKDIHDAKFKSKKTYSIINAYDNAIRYTDYIVRKVVESTKQLKVSSFVLYFSDHGEEVFDEIDFFGHSADQIITKNIYEIPMFIWLSEEYKCKKEIYNNLDLKYMSDDIFHSIADLCSVKSNEVDSTRSILNEYFKERKRLIRDTINYDTFFN